MQFGESGKDTHPQTQRVRNRATAPMTHDTPNPPNLPSHKGAGGTIRDRKGNITARLLHRLLFSDLHSCIEGLGANID